MGVARSLLRNKAVARLTMSNRKETPKELESDKHHIISRPYEYNLIAQEAPFHNSFNLRCSLNPLQLLFWKKYVIIISLLKSRLNSAKDK